MSKLSKKPSARRKFSFDLPNLKIGASKTDSRSSKDERNTGAESPPLIVKSIRPPLSPEIDQQLRQACAHVLKDFKTSKQLHAERHGKDKDARQQSDEFKPYHRLRKDEYAKARDGEKEWNDGDLSRPTTRKGGSGAASTTSKPSVGAQLDQRKIEPKKVEPLNLGIPQMKATVKSQAFFDGFHLDPPTLNAHARSKTEESDQEEAITVDLSSFNPPIASPAFFQGMDLDRIRKATAAAIQEPVPFCTSPEIAPQKLETSRERSHTSPTKSETTSVDRLRFPARADSVETTSSTAWTERTEHSRKPSTAPTSVAMTPGINSLRTSSQAGGLISEKFRAADIEKMREEFEDHETLHGEARAQRELENQVLSTISREGTPTHAKQSSTSSAHVLQRKPGFYSTAGGQRSHSTEQVERTRRRGDSIQERRNVPPVPQLGSTQSREFPPRSENRQQRLNVRSESSHELEMLRPESRESQLEVSRPASRSKRLGQIRGYYNDGTREPPVSIDNSKPGSRSESVASNRIVDSVVASSIESTGSKFRSWKSRQSQDESTNDAVGRPSIELSKTHSRDLHPEFQPSTYGHRRSKSSVNLNRELPPLPAVDQWTPTEPEKPKHISAMASPKVSNFSRRSVAASISEPNLLDRQEYLSPGFDPATASSSRIHSIYSRYSKIPDDWVYEEAPPYTPISTDADFPCSATHERFNFSEDSGNNFQPLPTPPALNVEAAQRRIPSEYMFRANFGVVTSPMMPPPIPFELKTEPKMTKRKTEDMFLPDLDAKARTASTDNTASQTTTTTTKKGEVVNYSRSIRKQPTVLRKPNLVRSQTQISAPIPHDKLVSHTKSASDQVNFSRKPSVDNYSRLYDMGYRNIVHIQPTQDLDVEPAPALVPTRSMSKRWWKR